MLSGITKIDFEAFVDTIVDGVMIIDSQGIILRFNTASEAIFGYLEEEVLGKNIKMLMPDPYHSEHDGYLKSYHETGEKKIIGIGREVQGRRKDGTAFPIDLSVGETAFAGQLAFVGTVRDLTVRNARLQKYEALKSQHYYLSRVSSMNQMGSAIAHEINQPMAASLNYIETARMLIARGEGVDLTDLSAVLDEAAQQVERATDIVSRMRRFIQDGKVQAEPVDIKDIVEASIHLAFIGLDQQSINVTREFIENMPLVLVDHIQIEQVLVNLIKNAIEAMVDTDDKRLAVSAVLLGGGEFIEVAVRDTGHGLSDEDMQSLFVPFASQKQKGLGVGLSICQSIITHHGGQLWAQQGPSGGSVFCFTLPVARASE